MTNKNFLLVASAVFSGRLIVWLGKTKGVLSRLYGQHTLIYISMIFLEGQSYTHLTMPT